MGNKIIVFPLPQGNSVHITLPYSLSEGEYDRLLRLLELAREGAPEGDQWLLPPNATDK